MYLPFEQNIYVLDLFRQSNSVFPQKLLKKNIKNFLIIFCPVMHVITFKLYTWLKNIIYKSSFKVGSKEP